MESESPSPPPTPRRRHIHLVVALLGIIIFVSWFTPGLEALWARADDATFFALNKLLGIHPQMDRMWARLNQRWFDVASGLPLAALMLWWIFKDGRATFRRRGAEMFVSLLLLVLVRYEVKEAMEHLDYHRASPSRVYKAESRRLNKLVPDIKAKTSSRDSFPGDHSLVSVWIALTFALLATRRLAALATILVVIAWMPRLVAGAHWLTDNIVGGMGITMASIGLALWLGVFAWLVQRVEWVARWLGYKFGLAWFQDTGSVASPA